MRRPSEIALLVHIAAVHTWLGLIFGVIDWTLAEKPEPPKAVQTEPRGPNNLERSCQ